ncbi:MAG: hypothetical protein QOE68_3127 [Thermoanaerobaculia bacterium]|nr:hypothetical protein [Thermoanaerobaculia bacterium]
MDRSYRLGFPDGLFFHHNVMNRYMSIRFSGIFVYTAALAILAAIEIGEPPTQRRTE